jgi:acetyl esterase/lipase
MIVPLFSGFRRMVKASQLNAMADRLFSTGPPAADARIPYGLHPQQFGDLRLPKETTQTAVPVVVVIHGGFWRAKYTLDHIGHLCAALTASGVATWSLEYRKIGEEGGAWPNTMLDVGLGTDHLRELAERYDLDIDRVLVTGHSAGGHLAAWAAGRHRIPEGDPLYMENPLPVVAVVPLAGVVDLRIGYRLKLSNGVVNEFLGGSPEEMPERYATASPSEMLPLGVKTVLIHGTDDPNVPYELSQLYAERAQAAGDDCTLMPLKRAGHFELIDPLSREWAVVRDTLVGLAKREV